MQLRRAHCRRSNFEKATTGAGADLISITFEALRIVKTSGLSDLVPANYHALLEQTPDPILANQVNSKVMEILRECESETRKVITENAHHVETLADALLIHKDMSAEQIKHLLGWTKESGLPPKTSAKEITPTPPLPTL